MAMVVRSSIWPGHGRPATLLGWCASLSQAGEARRPLFPSEMIVDLGFLGMDAVAGCGVFAPEKGNPSTRCIPAAFGPHSGIWECQSFCCTDGCGNVAASRPGGPSLCLAICRRLERRGLALVPVECRDAKLKGHHPDTLVKVPFPARARGQPLAAVEQRHCCRTGNCDTPDVTTSQSPFFQSTCDTMPVDSGRSRA
jgi:hypothetical protein